MAHPIRILVINPNSDEKTCVLIRETVDRFPQEGCQVDVVGLTTAPKLVASYDDRTAAVDELKDVLRRSENVYDAFILACHADPNLELAREIVSKPVVGIAEASMKLAASVGSGFVVISPTPKTRSGKYALAHKYHLDSFLKGVIVSKSDDPGCANYTGADRYIEKRLGVPVFDGVACALFLAAGLARYRQYKT